MKDGNGIELFTTSKGCYLREIESSDIHNIYAGLSDPEVYKYYGVRFLTLDACHEQMEFYTSLIENQTGHWWAISDERGEFAGAIGLNDRNRQEKTIEIGFWLLPAYWGRGIVADCIPFVAGFAKEHFKSQSLIAFVESENTACLRLLKKNKFELQTVLGKAEWKDGKWINLHVLHLEV